MQIGSRFDRLITTWWFWVVLHALGYLSVFVWFLYQADLETKEWILAEPLSRLLGQSLFLLFGTAIGLGFGIPMLLFHPSDVWIRENLFFVPSIYYMVYVVGIMYVVCKGKYYRIIALILLIAASMSFVGCVRSPLPPFFD